MKHLILCLSSALLIHGCNSTEVRTNEQVDDEPITSQATKWPTLNRFAPMYPFEQARAREQGCATIQYTVTPSYEIQDVTVVNSTHKGFAEEAKKVINKWKWYALPNNLLTSPVKTQTRFEFCLEDGSGSCSMSRLISNNECTGADVVASVGSIVRRY